MQSSSFKTEDEIRSSSYENDFGTAKEVYENCMNAGITSSVSFNNNNLNTPCGTKQKNNNSGSQKNNTNINLSDVNKPRKSSFVQKNLELHLSDSQRSKIEAILNSVKELTDTEKLLLYLKLPTREHDAPSTTNTKQEQTFAFQWIRNNLEECDSSVNLPKHEVYDEYRAYCESESLTRFLSAPDFGKIVKCIYPNVKARRLGTRGNSKYCYNGLQRKVPKESNPSVEPDINKPPEKEDIFDNKNIKMEEEEATCDQTFAAASALVCEWANKLLGRVFETLIGLAKFLVSGSYVSTKSMASFIVMSASEECINKLNSRYSNDALNPPTIPSKSQVIKSETMSPLTSSNFSSGTERIQSNEVNSTSDLKNNSLTCFMPSVGAQVVPDMPITKSDLSNSNVSCGKLKLGDYAIDVSTPVLMDGKSSTSSNDVKNDDILMDNIVIMNGKQDTSNNSKLNQNCSRSITNVSYSDQSNSQKTSGDGKRRKKRIDQLQSCTPYSKNKFAIQSQFSMKDTSGFHLQSSFTSYPPVPPSGVVGMQMQCNQFISWPMSSGDIVGSPDVDLGNFDLVSNDQRCHTAPIARTKCVETEQPLTPHINGHTVFNTKVKQTHKAKRNLFDMFNNNNSTNETNGSGMNAGNNDLFLNSNSSSLQNVPNIMPLSSKPNVERVVPTEPLKNIQGFSNVDMSEQDDDFSGIASNFYHVDGHELLKTCQPSENWINDWSNMTMPVMNFS